MSQPRGHRYTLGRHPGIKPGAPPGTLHFDPDARRSKIRVMAYGPEGLDEREIRDPDELSGLVGKWPVTWVNVDGLGDGPTIQRVGELFDLHPLAMEDVVNTFQRPKVETYGEQFYIVARLLTAGEPLVSEQLSMFLGEGFVLTFQEWTGDCLDPVRDRIRSGRVRIRSSGAGYLVYAILDAVVDNCFPILERYGERLEDLEEAVLLDPRKDSVVKIQAIRRDLLSLRRAVWPLRETISSLMRDATTLISEETRLFLRDAYDHTVQVIDLLETHRELASALMDFYLSSVGQKTNEVMRVLTIIATIFIPLSFIAGLYGMNFDPEASPLNLPELEWYFGYPFALGLMAAVAFALLLFFRRRGWLGSSDVAPDSRQERSGSAPGRAREPESR